MTTLTTVLAAAIYVPTVYTYRAVRWALSQVFGDGSYPFL